MAETFNNGKHVSSLTRRNFLRASILAAAGGVGMMNRLSSAYIPDAAEVPRGTGYPLVLRNDWQDLSVIPFR